MNILTLDIETAPNVAHVYGLFNQNISLAQLRETSSVLALTGKWYDREDPLFWSDYHDGHAEMIFRAHSMIDAADVVVHYNGRKFDIPHLYREFLLANMKPPSPVQQVDLLEVVRGQFNFASNKLDHVARQLGLGGKVSHSGHELWVKCMAGDPEAWEKMKEYNIGDVILTEQLYDRLKPWIKGHPHAGLYAGDESMCPNCGGTNLVREGFSLTHLSKFQRYRCADCGKWSRGKNAVATVDVRGVA